MLENDVSHTFIDTVRKKFIELGFPKSTSGQLSKIILPFKVDPIEKKVFARCNNFFYLEQIIKPYHEEIHDIVKKCWGVNFAFEIDNNMDSKDGHEIDESEKPPSAATIKEEISALPITQAEEQESLFSKYNFKSFVTGTSNIHAFQACEYIAQNIGTEPLFLYGQTGVGKTHLLHSIGNFVFEAHQNLGVVYLSIHDFVNEVIQQGIRFGKMDQVRKKYIHCDVLLVDDIQALEKKKVCQIEFFHIVNTLFQRKKLLVFASDRQPKEFKHLDCRLKSRFMQGALIEINLPTQQERISIIKQKSKLLNFDINDESINILAFHLKTNVREIEGAVNELYFKSVALKSSDKKQNLQNVIKQRLPEADFALNKKPILTLAALHKKVCMHFQISLADLTGTKRKKQFVLARHFAIYLAKEILHHKTCDIIAAHQRKHHKIVSYSLKKIKNLLDVNLDIKEQLDSLLKQIYF